MTYLICYVIVLIVSAFVLWFYVDKKAFIESYILLAGVVGGFFFVIGFVLTAFDIGDSYYSCHDLGLNPFPNGEPFVFMEAPPSVSEMITSQYDFAKLVDRMGNIVEYSTPKEIEVQGRIYETKTIYIRTDKNIILACGEHSLLQK